jgi:hypothetical protein
MKTTYEHFAEEIGKLARMAKKGMPEQELAAHIQAVKVELVLNATVLPELFPTEKIERLKLLLDLLS